MKQSIHRWVRGLVALTLALAPVHARAAEPEPAAAQAPVEGPAPADAVEAGPPPEQLAKLRRIRRAGRGLVYTGSALALTGFATTLAFTILGDREQTSDTPELARVERLHYGAMAGGALLAAGVAIVAVGGILAVNAKQRRAKLMSPTARVRVLPSLGGLVITGRF